MKEVSTKRVFGVLFLKLDQMGIPRTKLIEGFPVTFAEFDDAKQRMDWNLFVQILKRFNTLIGGYAELEKSGFLTGLTRQTRLVGYVLSLVKEPKHLYWALCTSVGPAFFSNVKFEYKDLGENNIRITLSIPPEYSDSPEFFQFYKGNLSWITHLHHVPNAIVEMELKPRVGVYTITIPPSMTLFKRFKRAFAALKGARGVVEELGVYQQQIKESYERLAAAKREIFENELKIQLFEKLAGASRMAALDRLAGGVGHEINNPLMILSLNADLLASEMEGAQVDRKRMLKQIEQIRNARDRIKVIVSSLMSIGAGNPDDPPKPVAVESILDAVKNLCSERFTKTGIRFDVAPCDPKLTVCAQRMLVGQAFVHLLNNAFDAALDSKDKWIRIDVIDEKDEVLFKVMDSGAGIPQAVGERIFDPFFSTKEVGQGVGLGLSLARKYIELQGTALTLDRSCGNTCFSFALKKTCKKNLAPKIS